MGFVIVEYSVVLTREEVIKLLIDSENVEKTTVDGENIIIMGSGTDEKFSDYKNGGLKHIFRTSVDFKDHDEYLWTVVTLTTKDKITYQGIITPLNPPDKMSKTSRVDLKTLHEAAEWVRRENKK